MGKGRKGGVMTWQTMQQSLEERSHFIFRVQPVFFDLIPAAGPVITGLVLVVAPDEPR